ncbi:MAG: Rrf2 family transcriptional regulator [Planctomycetota bacterium]
MPVHRTFSTKCIYALRAILELALKDGFGVVKSQQIASAQGIPLRFLEIILAELRQGGFVESRRGSAGGYTLARPSETITVAQVIEFIEGRKAARHSRLSTDDGENPFSGLWQQLDRACSEVLSSTNFAELADEEVRKRNLRVPNYVI